MVAATGTGLAVADAVSEEIIPLIPDRVHIEVGRAIVGGDTAGSGSHWYDAALDSIAIPLGKAIVGD